MWIVGGDGWGYDIGYGGLIMCLPAVATSRSFCSTQKFIPTPAGNAQIDAARGGRKVRFRRETRTEKRSRSHGDDLRHHLRRLSRNGRADEHTLKAFLEQRHTSVLRSSSLQPLHRARHQHDNGMQNQKASVNTGQWLLYRYNPAAAAARRNPLQLDSAAPRVKIADYFKLEQRFKKSPEKSN